MDGDQDTQVRLKRIDILLDEYRALYSLLAFRLAAIEKRVPITGVALYTVAGSVPSLEPIARSLLLLAMPTAAVWFLRTTISHIRAKQDIKLRLIEVEHHVNEMAGEELLKFQSVHPSTGRDVAGRSGQDSVLAVYFGTIGLLAVCAFLVATIGLIDAVPPRVYFGILGASAATLTFDVLFIRHYRSLIARVPVT